MLPQHAFDETVLHAFKWRRNSTAVRSEAMVLEFLHSSDSQKLKDSFVRWHCEYLFSLQNRVVFAPPPGEHRWPKNCYALLPNIHAKLGRARHRTKKQKRNARNKYFRDCRKIITSSACLTGFSSFVCFAFSWCLIIECYFQVRSQTMS